MAEPTITKPVTTRQGLVQTLGWLGMDIAAPPSQPTLPAHKPVTYRALPEEEALHQTDRTLDTLPLFAHRAGYHAAAGGPVEQLRINQRVATAALTKQLPALTRQWGEEDHRLLQERQQLDAFAHSRQDLFGAGATGADVKQYNTREKRWEQDYQQHAARGRQLSGYVQRADDLQRRFGTTPMHLGPMLPREANPGAPQGFLAQTGQTLSEFGRRMFPQSLSMGVGVEQNLPRARAQLMLTGEIPPLPANPGKTPAERQRYDDQTSAVRDLFFIHLPGYGLAPNAGVGRPIPERRIAAALKGMTPWQKSLVPVLRQQVAGERKAAEMAQLGPLARLDFGLLGASEGLGLASSLGGEALATRLLSPMAGQLVGTSAGRFALQAVPQFTGHLAAGTAVGGLYGGATAAAQGARPAQIAQSAGRGALGGLRVGAVTGGLSLLPGAARLSQNYLGSQWDAKSSPRVVDTLTQSYQQSFGLSDAEAEAVRQRLTTIGKSPGPAKGRMFRSLLQDLQGGRPQSEPPPTSPRVLPESPHPPATPTVTQEPRITMGDGSSRSLRHMSPAEWHEAAVEAGARGDTATVARIQQWQELHQAHLAHAQPSIPPEMRQEFVDAGHKAGQPAMAAARAFTAHANKVRATDPDLAAKLDDASTQKKADFQRGWHKANVQSALTNEAPPAPPAQASPWRRMSPEQRASLTGGVKRDLIIQDANNSLQALDPTGLPVNRASELPGRPKTGIEMEKAADDLFQQAQAHLAGSIPHPAEGLQIPPAQVPTEQPAPQAEARLQPVQAQSPPIVPAPPERPVEPSSAAPGIRITPMAEEFATGKKSTAGAVETPQVAPHEQTKAEFVQQHGKASAEELQVGMSPVAEKGAPGINRESPTPGTLQAKQGAKVFVFRDEQGVPRGTLEVLGATPSERRVNVQSLYVDPAWRGRKIASRLFDAMEMAGFQAPPLERRFMSFDGAALYHERAVRGALAEGKEVPAAVLKDYPRLQSQIAEGRHPGGTIDAATGLGNAAGWSSEQRGPAIAVARVSHPEAPVEALLPSVGQALREAGLGDSAFHLGEGKIAVTADNPEQLQDALRRVKAVLAESQVVSGDEGAHPKGIDLNYAIGKTEGEAERALVRQPAAAGPTAGAAGAALPAGGGALEEKTGGQPAAAERRPAGSAAGGGAEGRGAERGRVTQEAATVPGAREGGGGTAALAGGRGAQEGVAGEAGRKSGEVGPEQRETLQRAWEMEQYAAALETADDERSRRESADLRRSAQALRRQAAETTSAKQAFLKQVAAQQQGGRGRPDFTPTEKRNLARLDGATTGHPVDLVGLRQESGRGRVPGTGVFYALDRQVAAGYTRSGPGGGRRGDFLAQEVGPLSRLSVEPLRFENPLVIRGGHRDLVGALDGLPFSDAERAAIRAAWRLIPEREEAGYALLDKAIARAVRRAGFDALLYRHLPLPGGGAGEHEIVDLRGVSPALPAAGAEAGRKGGPPPGFRPGFFTPGASTEERLEGRKGGQSPGFDNPDMEKWRRENLAQIPKLEREAFLTQLGHALTRPFEHLPVTPYFAPLQNRLQRFVNLPNLAHQKAVIRMGEAVNDLTAPEYHQLGAYLLWANMAENAEKGISNPPDIEVLGPGALAQEGEALQKKLQANPKVNDAAITWRKNVDQLSQEYAGSKQALGLAEPGFTKSDWFHQEFLAPAMEEQRLQQGARAAGRGPVRAVLSPDFTWRREGGANYRSDPIQAHLKALSDMVLATEKNKLVALLQKREEDGGYNAMPRYKAQQAFGADKEARQWLSDLEGRGGKAVIVSTVPGSVGQLAAEGWLPTEPRFEHVTDAIAQNYALNQQLAPGAPPVEIDPALIGDLSAYAGWVREMFTPPAGGGKAEAAQIPKGYVRYQFANDHPLYRRKAIPVEMAQQLIDKTVDELSVTRRDLMPILAAGKGPEALLVKAEVAKTLDGMQKTPPGVLDRTIRKALGALKMTAVLNPEHMPALIKEHLIGSMLTVARANPGIFTKLPQAIADSYNARSGLLGTKKAEIPTADYQRFLFEGGGRDFRTTIGDVGEEAAFNYLARFAADNRSAPEKVWGVAQRLVMTGRIPVSRLDEVFRYATFLHVAEDIDKNDGPTKFLASRPDLAAAIGTINGRDALAYHMSNQLMGAYDEMPALLRQAADKIPSAYWGFLFGKAKAETGLMANNIWNQPQIRRELAARLGGKAGPEGGFGSAKVAAEGAVRFMWPLLLLSGVLTANNLLRNGKREDEMGPQPPHFDLYRYPDGKMLMWDRVGALPGLVSAIGADDAWGHQRDILNGNMTPKEVWREITRDGKSSLISLAAQAKVPYEVATGRRLGGGPIRDRGQWAADRLHVGEFYREAQRLAGYPVPSAPGRERLAAALLGARLADPAEDAFYAASQNARDWVSGQKDVPQEVKQDMAWTPLQAAIYGYRKSLQQHDSKSAMIYTAAIAKARLQQVLAQPKLERQGEKAVDAPVVKSLARMEPLYGMPAAQVPRYLKTLTPRDRVQLHSAYAYWSAIVAPKLAVSKEADLGRFIEATRRPVLEAIESESPVSLWAKQHPYSMSQVAAQVRKQAVAKEAWEQGKAPALAGR